MDDLKKIIEFFRKKKTNNEVDDKGHTYTMLCIYGIFIVVVVLFIRMSPDKSDVIETNEATSVKEQEVKKEENTNIITKIKGDINYSYIYTITFNGEVENYVGKKIDDKEKFSYIKNGITTDYAILNDNYLISSDGKYSITDNLNTYFRYCDVQKILNIIEKVNPSINGDTLVFTVENSKIASIFYENINLENGGYNTISIRLVEGNVENITMDLNNYISSILVNNNTLNISMDFANIGKVEDFNIDLK